MATDPNFVPVFGPNGAVMNAPSMTPEMRAKVEGADRPPTAAEFRRLGVPVLALLALALLVQFFGRDLIDLAQTSPWWAGAFSGAMAIVLLGFVVISTRNAMLRWELVGPASASRTMRLPMWGRLLFVTLYFAYSAFWAAAMLSHFVTFGAGMISITYLFGLGALLFGGFGVLLETLGRRWGWEIPAHRK